MANFKVHHVRFFDHLPLPIHCLTYDETYQRVALSRSDGSVEIWSIADNWYCEKVIPGLDGVSVEALQWCHGRLFSADLTGDVSELDINTLNVKTSAPSNGGAVWCLTANNNGTQLAAGTEDGCVVLFDITDEGVQYKQALDRQEGRILSIAWHETDEVIVTGGIDNIRLWNTASGHAVQRITLGRQEKNKETIVWCLAVTRDMTIISGDSRGKTCFWNGKQGTLIKSFQCHSADVLSLCVNKEGTTVFSSGIDPVLAQFEFTAAHADSDWKMWVRSSVVTQHSHDVRALAMAGDYVVSGGVDTNLIFNRVDTSKKGSKQWRKMPAILPRQLVHTAREAQFVMLQYPNYLEVWKLGTTSYTSETNGEILPLKTNPVKLVQLKAKGDEAIVCSAMSSDGQWLAYSDQDAIRLYHMTLEEDGVITPKVSITRIRHRPPGLQPAHKLQFTDDCTKLISASHSGAVQVTSFSQEQVSLVHTFPSPEKGESIHLLSVSQDGQYVATGNHSNNVHVYSLRKNKHVCTLPKYRSQPSALAFNPYTTELIVAYCDQKIYEYSVDDGAYTRWCRQVCDKWPRLWLKRHSKVYGISFPTDSQILLHDEQMLCVLDKSQPFPDDTVKLYSKSSWMKGEQENEETLHAFHICSKYKYLLHAEVLKDDWLVVVEKTPVALQESLPPTLKQKKFGE